MLKLFIIIQARMTSTRLPGKVLLPLCGKTVLEVMLDRLSGFRENIIIATTNDGSEKPIVMLCEKLGVNYYQGDTEDVLSRYYKAAVKYGAKEDDIVVRLTSDCPLIDQKIVGEIVNYYNNNNYDYVSNCLHRTYPRGLDTEVFSFSSLKNAYSNATSTLEKEHVTPYINNTHKDLFKIGHFKDCNDNSRYRLTLDEDDDYKAIKAIYQKLDCRIDFTYQELIEIMTNNSYIYDINAHVEQKKS